MIQSEQFSNIKYQRFKYQVFPILSGQVFYIFSVTLFMEGVPSRVLTHAKIGAITRRLAMYVARQIYNFNHSRLLCH